MHGGGPNRERAGSLSDKIAAFQRVANTAYRIPKPAGNHTPHLPSFGNSTTAAVRPRFASDSNAGGLVKGTARTARVSPKSEMGIGEDERRSKIASLRSRWELSTATGNALMPDQNDSDILRTAAAYVHPRPAPPPVPTVQRHPVSASTPDQAQRRRSFGGGGPWAPSAAPQAQPNFDDPSSISCGEADDKAALEAPTQDDEEEEEEDTDVDVTEEETVEEDGEMQRAKESEMLGELSDLLDEAIEEVTGEEEVRAEKEEEEPDASAPLVHSVSFYRNMQKQARAKAASTKVIMVRDSVDESSSGSGQRERKASSPRKGQGKRTDGQNGQKKEEEDLQAKLARLQAAVRVKQEQIAQASQALNVCRSTPGFRGSREEVQSQAILLIKTEERKALLTEMDAVANNRRARHHQDPQPKGTLTINSISLPLKREFINDNVNRSASLHYFILLVKHRETVHESQMINTDDALKVGRLQFNNYFTLQGLPPDFRVHLELYALRTTREQMSHEEKYHLGDKKGNTLRGTSRSARSYHASSGVSSPGGPLAILDPSFQQVGRLSLSLAAVTRSKFMLDGVQFSSPVEGSVRADLRVSPESAGAVEKRGWLNAYEEINGYGAWSRLYAVLKDGRMRFWKYADEIHSKAPLNEVELASCKNSAIRQCASEICTRPFSFYLDVYCQVDPADPNQLEKFRIMLAVDDDARAKDVCAAWLQALNQALSALRIWDPTHHR